MVAIKRFFFGLFSNSEGKIKKKVNGSNAEYHLSLSDVNSIIQACESKREELMIQLMIYTGIRRAELVDIEYSDIRWDENLILIKNGKGNKQRLVPIPDFLSQELKVFQENGTSDVLFVSRKGGKISCRHVNRIIATVGKRAGITNPNPKYKNITCHLFRHTFARMWKQNNGSIESLSYILGHSSQATTMDLYGKESILEMQQNYNNIFNIKSK